METSIRNLVLTLIQKIANMAAPIPNDWRFIEKSLATGGGIDKAKVMTGKNTEPPPSLVIPKKKNSVHNS